VQLIESYMADRQDTIVLEGRTYPAVCLVESTEDGMRWLLHHSADEVYGPLWARASAAGAVGIISPSDFKIRAMTAERFAEDREERRPNYVIPRSSWSLFDHVPDYSEVYAAPRGGLVIPRQTLARTGFVHGHTHAEYSSLDGLSTVSELVAQAVADGQPGLALTDHGRVSGHPELQAECDKAGIKPVFGIEAYFQDDRFARSSPDNTPEQNREIRYGYHHLILWAMDDEGLHNLWAMSTESFRDGMYDKKPRMDWDTLRRHSTGIMAASGCLRGPLAVPVLNDDEGLARTNLAKLLDIFGDRFYLEVQPNALAEQRKVNEAMVRLGKEFGVPLMATVDSHYPQQTDHDAHQAWIAVQTDKDVADEGDLFAVNLDLYMQTEEDVRRGLAYLGPEAVEEAVGNTLDLVTRTDARIGGKPEPPVFSKKGGHKRDTERLLDVCLASWSKVETKGRSEDYMARFEREFALLKQKDFCGYFLMVADYCRWAKEEGILVGPGRGSGGGSLVAYLCGITEIDPVEGDLPFERFMTEGRTSLPDFDVDFPASMKEKILGYLADTYGADFVVQIGTHLRLKSKGIVKDLTRSMMSVMVAKEQAALDEALESGVDSAIGRARERLAERRAEVHKDMAKVADIVKLAESDKAGLGMAWEDLWAQFGDDLQPYREKYPELFSMADRLQGRLKSYGKHAAGVVISTDRALTGWLPLMGGEDGRMVTQFDMNALESMGLVKFDILTIRTLDTVQWTVDLVKEIRDVSVDVYDWQEEYQDPQVWEEVAAAKTLGIFQIETHAGTRLCQRMGPLTLAELCDMITLVRPGPMRSGLTELYLKRRAGLEPVSYPDPRMEEILGPTWGCMIYQEQIMSACIVLGGYTSDEADEVRKILGKKKIEKIGPAGQEFVTRAVANGMEREAAQHLWDQMAEFAKYSFGKAHAYAYAVLAYWTAWLKFHYPVEFFTAALSTIDQKRIPEFIKEVRRNGYTVLPPDINASRKGFQAEPLAVRYGLDAINGIGEAAVDYLIAGQPYASWEAFDEYVTQKGSGANAGIQMLLAKVGAMDSLEPHRAGLVRLLEMRKSKEDAKCVHLGSGTCHEGAPAGCGFDWSTEEPPVNPRTLKVLPRKPPPKRCTKACRQYTPRPPLDLGSVEPYDDETIRAIEHELLGVFLSSTPFDRLDPVDRQRLLGDAEEMPEGDAGRMYTVAAILMGIRKTKTRASGDEMAFLNLDTELSTVEAVCFPRKWAEIKTGMHEGQLCLVVLEKQADDKGYIVQEYLPV